MVDHTQKTSPEVLPDTPSPFPQDDDSELVMDSLCSEDDEKPAPPEFTKFENQLNQMARMLKDLNG